MKVRSLSGSLLITTLSLVVACSAKSGSSDGNDDASSTQAEGDGSSDSSSTSGEGQSNHARGIVLHDIRANQGAAIPLWLDGQYQDGSLRKARLLAGRDTLFRAAWTLEEGWEARQIRADLVLEGAGGPVTYTHRRSGPHGPGAEPRHARRVP